MFLEFLKESVKREKPNSLLKQAKTDAKTYKAYYSGEGLDELLTNYRKRESEPQKDQRKRITIGRTKHVTRQIENVLNQLDIMDKPGIHINVPNNEKATQDVKDWVYNNNITSFAFQQVRQANMCDANSFLRCSINKYKEVEFTAVTADNLYDFYSINGVLKAVVFEFERKLKDGLTTVKDYELFHNEGFITFTNKNGYVKESDDEVLTYQGEFIVKEVTTTLLYAFQLGYIVDSSNKIPTCFSIMERASELLKSLLWQGSELDTDLATHGILQKFAYAKKCNYNYTKDDQTHSCVGGFIRADGHPTGTKCSNCNGSGMQIHTSSQDIIQFPLPEDGNTALKLSDLSHTVFAPIGTFEFKEKYVEKLEQGIIKTVFNASIVTKDEIAATATEKVIDLQGIYSALNLLGQKVSDCFIWMVECYAAIQGYKKVEVNHGYTLSLKLESVETLAEKRKKFIDANAPIEVIKAIDLAIIQKQHMDNPVSLNRLIVWEMYRPFADKSDNTAMQILSGLSQTNSYKILYQFWGEIKRNIEIQYGSAFFEMMHLKRKEIIDKEVDLIRQVLVSEVTPQRPQFDIE